MRKLMIGCIAFLLIIISSGFAYALLEKGYDGPIAPTLEMLKQWYEARQQGKDFWVEDIPHPPSELKSWEDLVKWREGLLKKYYFNPSPIPIPSPPEPAPRIPIDGPIGPPYQPDPYTGPYYIVDPKFKAPVKIIKPGPSDWNRVIVEDGKYYWPDTGRGSPRPGYAYAQVILPLTQEEIEQYKRWKVKGDPVGMVPLVPDKKISEKENNKISIVPQMGGGDGNKRDYFMR